MILGEIFKLEMERELFIYLPSEYLMILWKIFIIINIKLLIIHHNL